MIEATADNFEAEVLEAGVPVLVDFYSPHCGPCRAMVPVLEKLSAELDDQAKIVKVDVSVHESLARQFDVQFVPTLIVFKNGAEVARMVGTQPKAQLMAALDL